MGWRIRDTKRNKIPADKECPDYGDCPEYFTIKMYHSGTFHSAGPVCYIGGSIAYVDFCDTDEMSMLEVNQMVSELGLANVDKLFYNRNGPNNCTALLELEHDMDAANLGCFKDESGLVGVYVSHVQISGVGEGETSDGVRSENVCENESQLVVYVPRNSSDEPKKTDFSQNEFAEITLSDESDDLHSVGSDTDISEKFVDSESELEDDDDILFEENVDDEAEWGGLHRGTPKSAGGGSSSRVPKGKQTHNGYPVFKHAREGISEPEFFVTQCFEDTASFRRAVRIHSIVNGRDVSLTVNNGDKVQAKCNHKTCPWVIFASAMKGEKTIQVKTFCDKHRCPRAQRVRHANAKLIADVYRDKIYTDPTWPVDSMISWINKDLNVEVNRMVCYRAKYMVLKMGSMCESEEYALLWRYAEEISQTNPHTTVKIKCKETVEGVRFKRMYICWGALKRGFLEGCRPIIFLDGCHLKTGAGGIVLSAVGIDGNNGVFPFAYAVVEKEKGKTWSWFIRQMLEDLGSVNHSRWTIMSDKQKGLIDAIDTLMPGCEHRFCVTHLYQNFKQQHKGLQLKNLLWRAARATRVADFDKVMGEIKKTDVEAFKWLAAKPPANWSRSHFRTFSVCDKLENNMSESFNAMMLKARSKAIVSMFESIRVSLMKRVHIRRDKIRAYHGEFCPVVENMLEDLKKKAMDYRAIWNGENQFEIESSYGTRFRVHLGEGTCSCRRWELTGLPCAHAISAIWYLNLKPESYVNKCYKKETFLKAYSHFLGALDASEMWPKTKWPPLLPPIAEKMPGRPKTYKRKPQTGEGTSTAPQGKPKRRGKRAADKPVKMTRKGTVMSCSFCHQPNHNARSCPKKPSPPANMHEIRVGLDIPAPIEEGTSRPKKKSKKPKGKSEGGLDIPAPVEEGTSRPLKKSKKSKEKSAEKVYQEPTSKGKKIEKKKDTTPAKKPPATKRQKKPGSAANIPPSQESQQVNEGMDILSSVPDVWWNVTSAEQASQLSKEQMPTSQLTKEQGTPSRVTRSKATKIVAETIRQSQGVAAASRSTPSRAAKKSATCDKNAKCTQESSSVVAEKPQPVRRKLQVRKARTLRDPLDGPSIVKIDKPNPRHFIKPPGASTLTSDVRFSTTSRDDPSQKVFISPDAPSHCKQM